MATQLKQEEAIEPDADGGEGGDIVRDFDAEARSHGWLPKEEFKGDPSRWTDAETFVKRADEVMPLLKKKTEQQERKIKDLERMIKRASDHFSKAEERAYDRALADLRKEQEAAVETGDLEAHRAVTKKIDELKKDVEADTGGASKFSEVDVQEALIDFKDANPWYDEGGKMKDYADLIAMKHKDMAAETPPAEFFAFIADEVLKRYPLEKGARKPRASAVEAPSGRRSSGGKTFADLPVEAQRMADKWIANGLIKSREDYVKTYPWEKPE